MTIPYPTGWFEKSGIVHYIWNHYESVSGGYIGGSLCGRMRGMILEIGRTKEVQCKACQDRAREEMKKYSGGRGE